MAKLRLAAFVFISLFALTIAGGCGQESTGDAMAREQNRERERQHYIESQSQPIQGVYRGETKTSDIFLSIEPTRISNGSSVPLPALAGSLVVSPRLAVSIANRRIQYSFSFQDGIFDPHGGNADHPGGRLSFTLEKDGHPSNVSCLVDRDGALTCTWNITAAMKFKMKPSTNNDMALLSQEATDDVVYIGHDDQFNIVAQFDSEVITRDGSRIPEPTIMGYIIFFNRSDKKLFPDHDTYDPRSGFRSGAYDLFTDKITVTMDEDSQVTLVCKLLDGGSSLDCKWHTRSPRSFVLHRATRPSAAPEMK